jgi:dTMP kinase
MKDFRLSYMQGKLIVIEGGDGSGKATHLKLALEHLKEIGREVEVFDFPQYGTKSAGPVEEYLNGKYGDLHEVSPYAASLLYAVDRFDASRKIQRVLGAGNLVLSNRYVLSNAAHQGVKIKDPAERQKFWKWLEELEYGTLELPRPNLTIFLHVPADIGYGLVAKKSERTHLHGKQRDIHEANLPYLKEVEAMYVELAKKDPTITTIECAPQGVLLSIETIGLKVSEVIEANL